MFFDMHPTAIPLYEAFEAKLLERFPYPLESDRVAVKTEPYPGRWTTHIVVGSTEEVDDELFAWVQQAHILKNFCEFERGISIYTIGQVSEMFHFPISTLRCYNKALQQSPLKEFAKKNCLALHCIDYSYNKK